MGLFRRFIEGKLAVSMGQAPNILKNWGSSYQPGQFGIEIEYRVTEEEESNDEIDSSAAWDAFNKEVKKPQSLKDWEKENKEPEEPEKPDKSFYEYDKDPLVNYWNLELYKTPMDKELPPIFDNDYGELNKLFENIDSYAQAMMISRIREQIINIKSLYKRASDNRYGYTIFDNFPWHIKRLQKSFLTPDRFNSQIFPLLKSGDNFQLNREQENFINELHDASWDALEEFYKFHENRAKSITKDNYAQVAEPLWQKELKAWQEEHAEWQEEYQGWQKERSEIKEKHDKWNEDEEFGNWLVQNSDRFYVPSSKNIDVQKDIKEMKHWLQNNLNDWEVYEDEAGIVEIASPILSVNDLESVKELLSYLRDNKQFDSGTGLHVHIGMPSETDAFDLLSMAASLDEPAVMAKAGRTEMSQQTAKQTSVLFKRLWDLPEGLISIQDLHSKMNDLLDRYYGVNTVGAFNKYKTVELRYLSSQIINNGIDSLIKYINYFLMLPNIAKGRSQIRQEIPGIGTIFLSRRSNGMVEVKKFPLGKKIQKVSMANLPVSQLRQPVITSKVQQIKQQREKEKQAKKQKELSDVAIPDS